MVEVIADETDEAHFGASPLLAHQSRRGVGRTKFNGVPETG